jgi:hypothetical protein
VIRLISQYLLDIVFSPLAQLDLESFELRKQLSRRVPPLHAENIFLIYSGYSKIIFLLYNIGTFCQ